MSILSKLFGKPKPKPTEPEAHSTSSSRSRPSRSEAATQNAARREVLQLALRESLQRHGIPITWVTADVLVSTSRNQQPGLHWRLVIKHWDPRLVLRAVALQKSLVSRVSMYDPTAEAWLSGISWQFALADDSACPAMPHPGSWTAEPHEAPSPNPQALAGDSGGVIAGPVRIGDTSLKSDLERLMAVRDADFQDNTDAGPDATQPMFLNTRPAEP